MYTSFSSSIIIITRILKYFLINCSLMWQRRLLRAGPALVRPLPDAGRCCCGSLLLEVFSTRRHHPGVGAGAGMEAVHVQGIWMAESLQLRAKSQEKFWLIVTHMGDPKAAFLLVFPFTYFISRRAGVAVLWVAAVSEWLNLLFKW